MFSQSTKIHLNWLMLKSIFYGLGLSAIIPSINQGKSTYEFIDRDSKPSIST